jgi:4a-hydroxytetrahydrobiopterin dehydratase
VIRRGIASVYVVALIRSATVQGGGERRVGGGVAARIGFLRIARTTGTGGIVMTVSATGLAGKRCQPCEGGVPPLAAEQVREHLAALPQWKLSDDGKRIRREWRVKDFAAALDFFYRVGQVAEEEDHHPDLHLTGYRNVVIEIWTHAVGGLSENDFILAAKVDTLPVELKG